MCSRDQVFELFVFELSRFYCTCISFCVVGDNDEVCGNPADIVFILDSSRSIYGKDFNISKDFVKKLVSEFDIGPEKTEVAALQFAKKTGVEFKFNSSNSCCVAVHQ